MGRRQSRRIVRMADRRARDRCPVVCPFIVCTVIAVGLFAIATCARAEVRRTDASRLNAAAAVLRVIRDMPDTQLNISPDVWQRVQCMIVIPNVRVSFMGGESGRGVMSCRAGERWSAPLLVRLEKGSGNFPAATPQLDLILLVVNESSIEKLLRAATDVPVNAEILAYSRAHGLFGAVDLSGCVLRPDREANRSVYGAGASPRTILASGEISAPTEAAPLLQALAQLAAVTSTHASGAAKTQTHPFEQVPSVPTLAGGTAARDAELRGRIAEMQRSIDRMLVDSASTPVGTVGSENHAARGATSVDREGLLRLRQQLDEMVRMLSR